VESDRLYWLVWSQIPGLGPVLLKRIYQQFETLENAWKATPRALGTVNGLGEKLIAQILDSRSGLDPVEFYARHLAQNPQFWTPADPDYPRLLWETPSPPPVLYYQGAVNPLENQGAVPAIALVGTRFPTEHGRRWTIKISRSLAQHGFVVVSGLAAGIDGEAHRSCLAAGGRTWAVLGTGLDLIYPPQHRDLFQEITQKGLIITEYPRGTKPDRGNFPARNRIIAGLCRGILVLEAPTKSGSLITARYATEFNRDVYTLPNSPEVEEARGCLRLIHNGAEVIVDLDELLNNLGVLPPLDAPQGEQLSLLPPAPDLAPLTLQVYGAVTLEPLSFDSVVQRCGLDTGTVSGELLQLELLGLVTQLPGMRYQRVGGPQG
jgi:DNA processing protein